MSKKGSSSNSSVTKDDKKNGQKIQKSSSFSLFKILFFTSSVLAGFSSYFVYTVLTTYPELPQLDMDQWWGRYPIDPKPDTSIRPFKIEFDDVMIYDLRERLLHQRPFTPPLEDAGFTYGFNTNFLTQVLDYWKNKYNFKERERFLNKYEHFKTKIQGLDIHFIRVTPKVEDNVTVLPLLMLHSWPGSIREFYEIIPLLTTPRPGYQFVFDVIVPSLPGFGYSQGAARAGLGPAEMAVVLHQLMARVGAPAYYVQGGGVGHVLGAALATLFPQHVLGFHTNTPVVVHRMAAVYAVIGSWFPSWVVEDPELAADVPSLTELATHLLQETGYLHLHATKPDTVGVALTDSPAGLAAYILEKFSLWTDPAHERAADGDLLAAYPLTHLLDHVMLYWATNSITTSLRLYKEFYSERSLGQMLDEIPTAVPTAALQLAHAGAPVPVPLLRRKYPRLLLASAARRGGHFAAMQLPALLAQDLFRAAHSFAGYHARRKPEENTEAPELDTANSEAPKQETASTEASKQKTANTEVPKQKTTSTEAPKQKTATKEAPKQKTANVEAPNWETAKTIFEFTVKDINGNDVKLDRYKGHVTIIVNVASQCGLTHTNYLQLNELYEKYSVSKGLRIIAFPCNQFGGQEPGNHRQIFEFTKDRGVKFDLFEKVEVNGENAHPLWKFLKRSQSGTLGDFIKWNFSKFIIDKNGVPVERLAPNVNPLDLEPYLAKYW